jgi:hypothetical protein
VAATSIGPTMQTCLVLGAGASRANGLYFRAEQQRETLPPLDATFFETVDSKGILLTPSLRDYFRNFLGIEPTPATLRERRMEEVFADVFFDFRETPTDKGALDAYVDLVDLYIRVLRENTNWLCADGRNGAPVGRLLAEASGASDSLTVITFNHDLVIENEIHRRARLSRRWCLDEGYGSISSSLNVLVPQSGDPVFKLHSEGLCDHDSAITVLKLHGSMNWRVRINSARPTANALSGGATGETHLLTSRRLAGREVYVKSGGRGRTQWKLWPVVVPPVYEKQALRGGVIQSSWADARSAIEFADRVLFFGYSLPTLDVEAGKLFERALTKNRQIDWVDVVNPSPAAAARFAAVAPTLPLRWYPGLDEFIASGAFSGAEDG